MTIYSSSGPNETSYVLTRTVFDAGGRTALVINDKAGTTAILYDGADRRIQVTDPLSNVVAKQFDAGGNLVLSTRTEVCTIGGPDSETFAAAMYYDCLNQLVLQAEQGADGTLDTDLVFSGAFWQLAGATLISCLACDSRGNAVLTVDAKGNGVIAVFDGASRMIQTQQLLRTAGQGDNDPGVRQLHARRPVVRPHQGGPRRQRPPDQAR